jgi:hypothetical protein
MKKLIILIFTAAFYNGHAQDTLKTLNFNREHIKKTGMEVLGAWAIANLATGTIASFNTTGSTRYFHQMNAIWNVVNLGAAISGFINAAKNTNQPLTAIESLKEQRKIENIFLINGGLDLVYIGTGIYLNNRGNSHNNDKLKGYGSGIILQGAFLLLFDGTMYASEKSNGNKLRRFLEKNPVIFDGKKVGMILNIGSQANKVF